jgi:hypothetical protein
MFYMLCIISLPLRKKGGRFKIDCKIPIKNLILIPLFIQIPKISSSWRSNRGILALKNDIVNILRTVFGNDLAIAGIGYRKGGIILLYLTSSSITFLTYHVFE